MKIQVIKEYSKIKRERYEFEVRDSYGRITIVLCDYFLEEKETTRKRKYESKKWYSRNGDQRMISIYCDRLRIEDVPFPEEVRKEVMARLISEIKFDVEQKDGE